MEKPECEVVVAEEVQVEQTEEEGDIVDMRKEIMKNRGLQKCCLER